MYVKSATPMPDGTIRNVEGLISAGFANPADRAALEGVASRYAVAVPPAFAGLIEHAADPIARQVLPDPAELQTALHELADPVGDAAFSPLPGLVHRYADRVLIKPLLICPLYCRFCFRRAHVGPDGGLLTQGQLDAAIAYVAARPAISEVILTGGDPLMLSPRRLAALLGALAAMPHIEILRIHTRVPVAAPERITEELLRALDVQTPLYLAVHANHAREFTPDAAAALRRLSRVAVLLGQSVLLRGVNDSVAALEDLFRAMLRHRIKPYYLHQLDPAPGTSRFHVPIADGQKLLAGLRGRVTGLAWPTYVLDIAGGHGKVPIGPTYLEPGGPAGDQVRDQVRDPGGARHLLADPASTV